MTLKDTQNSSSPVQILLLQMFSSALFRLAGGEMFKYALRRLKTQKVFPVQGQLLRKNSWLILQGAFETFFFLSFFFLINVKQKVCPLRIKDLKGGSEKCVCCSFTEEKLLWSTAAQFTPAEVSLEENKEQRICCWTVDFWPSIKLHFISGTKSQMKVNVTGCQVDFVFQ